MVASAGEKPAVAASPGHRAPPVHEARARRLGSERGDVGAVPGARRLRHEQLDRLAEDFRRRVAEQRFRTLVEDADAVFSVHGDDRVGGRRKEPGQRVFRFPAAALGVPLAADVAARGHDAVHAALRVGHGRQRQFDVEVAAVARAMAHVQHPAIALRGGGYRHPHRGRVRRVREPRGVSEVAPEHGVARLADQLECGAVGVEQPALPVEEPQEAWCALQQGVGGVVGLRRAGGRESLHMADRIGADHGF